MRLETRRAGVPASLGVRGSSRFRKIAILNSKALILSCRRALCNRKDDIKVPAHEDFR